MYISKYTKDLKYKHQTVNRSYLWGVGLKVSGNTLLFIHYYLRFLQYTCPSFMIKHNWKIDG